MELVSLASAGPPRRVFLELPAMNVQIPSDFVPFVQRLLAERRFGSEQDLLEESLRLLQKQETLRREIQKGIDELDEGMGIDADVVFEEAFSRIAEIERGKGENECPR